MKNWISAIKDKSETIQNSTNATDLKNAEDRLQHWLKAPKKYELAHYFDDPLFGACYTNKLFYGKVVLFSKVLKVVTTIPYTKSVMNLGTSVVNFSSGPGPQILAYIRFMQKYLGVKELQIEAVDKYEYWNIYIEEMNKIVDLGSIITFKKASLSNGYLDEMASSDVCIMLFPHVMTFPDIWQKLMDKFILIILVDLCSKSMQKKLIKLGFVKRDINRVGIYTFVNHQAFFKKHQRNLTDEANNEVMYWSDSNSDWTDSDSDNWYGFSDSDYDLY